MPAMIHACLSLTRPFARVALAVLLVLAAQSASCLAAPGGLDTGFNPGVTGGLFNVFGTTTQADARILVGGSFTTVGGQGRKNIARLGSGGAVESTTTFAIGAGPDNPVYCMALQADGKVLIAGVFENFDGAVNTTRLARLNANGTVDSSFNPGTGPDDLVHCMAVQPDGKIIIGGLFTSVNGQARNRVARLNADGSLESTSTFNAGSGADDHVYSLALQPDGRIVIGGLFTSVNGQPCSRLARLGPDGLVETSSTFNAGTGPNNRVYCITLQPDGRILIAGNFTSVNGQARTRVARLSSSGALEDTTMFNPGSGADYYVNSMALQADGKILLGGGFTTLNGAARSGVARLLANGTLDSGFNPGTGTDGADVNAVAIQADGKVLVAGSFTVFNGTTRNLVARLDNDSATQVLNISHAEVQWLRGGAAPELQQVMFELSTDGGGSWTPLGSGARVAGGWRLGGLSLPANGSLRARGCATGGFYNGCFSRFEQTQAFTVTLPTPSESWRLTWFGSTANSGNGADGATPDQDGIPNLLKYALLIDPGSSGAALLPQGVNRSYGDGNRLSIVFNRAPPRSDISLFVEVADTPAGLQTSPTVLASSVNGAAMTGPGLVQEQDIAGGAKRVEVRDVISVGVASRRFMRIRVVR